MATITVLGAGMMGSALCVPLVDGGHDVRLVGTHLDDEIIERLAVDRFHITLRHGLPEPIRPFFLSELDRAMEGVELIVLGVSSAGIRWAADRLAPILLAASQADGASAALPVVMITKGLEWDGERLQVLPDVVRSLLPGAIRSSVHPAAIAGPCIAGELARRVPSCVVLTGSEPAELEGIASCLRGDYYHLWTSADVVGVEICAALKNAYAMGVALAPGLHLARGGAPGSVAMHNVEAAVMAQAIWEMRRIVDVLGGDPDSAFGLAGVGDLDVTNNGGRTGRFGALLGQGLSRGDAIERMQGATLECLEIIEVMRQAAAALVQRGALGAGELPLLDHMVAVLDGAAVDLPLERFFAAPGRP